MTRKSTRVFGPLDHNSASRLVSLNNASGWTGAGLALSFVLGVGCTQDYEISAVESDDDIVDASPTITPSAAPNSVVAGTAQAVEDNTRVGAGSAVPSAPETGTTGPRPKLSNFDQSLYSYDQVDSTDDSVDAYEDVENRERQELYDVGPQMRTPVVDFLFVVDNSTSMGRIRDLVRSGLVGLYDEDPFPAEARIAVMSTIPADPSNFSQLHPRVNDQGAQRFEPGFLRLVDQAGIQKFRKEAPELAASFEFDGCEDAWFEPWQENAQGVPCMIAHTQISRTPVRMEAGLSAFQQFLQKREGRTTFREGAAVHVIFVSDTHSPGLSGGQKRLERTGLEVDPITYSDLQKLVDADNMVRSFKVHAIAPATECVEEWAYLGPRYFNVAEASGGVTLDICTADDYSTFIHDLVEDSGRIERPILSLGRPSTVVHEVLLDGEPVAFDVVGDGTAVRLKGLQDPRADRKLTVHYRY
ncbi:MAG TPA: hypothetical protein DFR83_13560 [Deltaproteobacteria bacterium]|nr:hypothetical protein [Deltaproteobacteria bacterium]